jgi:hypothetical protein
MKAGSNEVMYPQGQIPDLAERSKISCNVSEFYPFAGGIMCPNLPDLHSESSLWYTVVFAIVGRFSSHETIAPESVQDDSTTQMSFHISFTSIGIICSICRYIQNL